MTWLFMTAVALLFDLLQFLVTLLAIVLPPVVLLNTLITGAAITIFWVWFTILGVPQFSGTKMGLKLGSALSTTIIELVPFISGLPGITVGVTGMILASRIEDREKAKEAAKKAAQMRPRMPANDNFPQAANDNVGVRMPANDNASQAANDNEGVRMAA